MTKLSAEVPHLWHRDKRQIESIVRTDIARGRGYNNEVTERYPLTFVGVDKVLARAYYNLIWNQEMKK